MTKDLRRVMPLVTLALLVLTLACIDWTLFGRISELERTRLTTKERDLVEVMTSEREKMGWRHDPDLYHLSGWNVPPECSAITPDRRSWSEMRYDGPGCRRADGKTLFRGEAAKPDYVVDQFGRRTDVTEGAPAK